MSFGLPGGLADEESWITIKAKSREGDVDHQVPRGTGVQEFQSQTSHK